MKSATTYPRLRGIVVCQYQAHVFKLLPDILHREALGIMACGNHVSRFDREVCKTIGREALDRETI